MLSIWSIFLSLNVAPKRIDTNLKRHLIEEPPKLKYSNLRIFKSPNVDAAILLLSGLQYSKCVGCFVDSFID